MFRGFLSGAVKTALNTFKTECCCFPILDVFPVGGGQGCSAKAKTKEGAKRI